MLPEELIHLFYFYIVQRNYYTTLFLYTWDLGRKKAMSVKV